MLPAFKAPTHKGQVTMASSSTDRSSKEIAQARPENTMVAERRLHCKPAATSRVLGERRVQRVPRLKTASAMDQQRFEFEYPGNYVICRKVLEVRSNVRFQILKGFDLHGGKTCAPGPRETGRSRHLSEVQAAPCVALHRAERPLLDQPDVSWAQVAKLDLS